ncbi:hypothetical protein [Thorsellia kenyensis]|uniref:Uncharacterized protein n=1 Tax=Thorsellia kenyensis TaxID=1549888 RepID=A0ABV6C7E1_9GAMM
MNNITRNQSFVTESDWKKIFKDYLIVDCSVRDKNIHYFALRKDLPAEEASLLYDSEIQSVLLAVYLHRDPFDGISYDKLSGFSFPKTGVGLLPRPQGLLSSRGEGAISVMGAGGPFPIEYIKPDEMVNPMRLVCIEGYTYAVCLFREIYRRVDVGQWESFDEGIEKLPSSELGFRDMDGFSQQNMYAVGGAGDVWRYDGARWQQCGFPSNEQLSTVCCAGDGYVYIGGEGCSVWRGKENTWELLIKGRSTILWNDLLWFQDKLWLASDNELKILNGDALEIVDGNGVYIQYGGHMDARDGVLLITNHSRAALYDGTEWRTIVKPY